jgi:hypothetical protein
LISIASQWIEQVVAPVSTRAMNGRPELASVTVAVAPMSRNGGAWLGGSALRIDAIVNNGSAEHDTVSHRQPAGRES